MLTVNQFAGKIPESDWLRFAILLLALLAVLQVVRLVSRVNRYVLFTIFFIGSITLISSWVHNRNEPAFLTPMVEIVQPWFPKRLRSSFDV
jgi:hypothetical protein